MGTKDETLYLKPNSVLEWLMAKKPTTVYQGQVCNCLIDGVEVAVSSPHVVLSKTWPHSVPASKDIGPWFASIDGREVSFAKLLNREAFGFPEKSVEAVLPKNGEALLKGALLNGATKTVEQIRLPGLLEPIESAEHRLAIKGFLERSKGAPAMIDRLTRAPGKVIWFMKVDIEARKVVQGLSGSIIWQQDKPVAVLAASLFLDSGDTLLLVEPLLEAGKSTLPNLK